MATVMGTLNGGKKNFGNDSRIGFLYLKTVKKGRSACKCSDVYFLCVIWVVLAQL
ncbi:unnamed protein product [Camellia sinensis]